MICVTVEIGEGALTRWVWITAPSIERALKIARPSRPDRVQATVAVSNGIAAACMQFWYNRSHRRRRNTSNE